MRIKYVGKTDSLELINGKTYNCISIEKDWYRVIDESGEDYLYPPDEFVIVKEEKHPEK